MRGLTRALAWICGAAAILLAAAVVLVLSLDWRGQAAPRLEHVLSEGLGRRVSIGGAVRVGVWLKGPTLIAHDVRLANVGWGSEPQMLTIQRVKAKFPLLPLFSREVHVEALELETVRALVETDTDGLTNRPRPGPVKTPSKLGAAFVLEGPRSVTARDIDITYREGPSAKPIAIALERLRFDWLVPGLKVEAKGVYRSARVGLIAVLSDPLALVKGDAAPVEAGVTVGATTILIKGRVASPTRGGGSALRLDGKGPNLRDVGALAGIEGLSEDGPLAFSLDVVVSQSAFAVNEFSASLGSATIVGSATAVRAPTTGAPQIEVVLASDTVDLELLRGDWGKLLALPTLWSLPIPVDLWRKSRVDLTYQAQSASYRDLDAADVDIRVLFDDGVVTVYPLTFSVDDVPLDAELSLALTGEVPLAHLRMDARRFPLSKVLAASGVLEGLEGPADLSVDVQGKGNSLKQIAASLQGNVDLALGPGHIQPRLLAPLPDQARGAWTSLTRASTAGAPFDCVLAKLVFDRGQADNSTAVMSSGAVQIATKGTVDLGSDRIDMLMSVQPREKSLLRAVSGAGYSAKVAGPVLTPAVAGTAFTPIAVELPKTCALATDRALVPRETPGSGP